MIESSDHTLIFTSGGGRLGNQLLHYANLLAFSLENPNFNVINISFSPYVSEYGNDSLYRFPSNGPELQRPWDMLMRVAEVKHPVVNSLPYLSHNWTCWPIHRAASYRSDAQSIIGGLNHGQFGFTELYGDRYDQFDLADSENVARLRSRRVSVVAGSGVRGWSLVEKHTKQIRSLLQPGENHKVVADRFVESLRDEFDILVGALVRQGDYRTWNGGQFFFESSEYRNLLIEFANEVFPKKKVGILLASDEPQSKSVFDDNRFVFSTGIAGGTGHYVETFTELSLCDVVVTPPSTFSVFAAFLGNIPVYPLYQDIRSEEWVRLESPLIDSIDHQKMGESVN